MEIINKKEIDELGFKMGFHKQILDICELLEKVGVGEGVRLGPTEWQSKNYPTSTFVNRYFKNIKSPKRFKMKSIQSHKGWVFYRTV